MASLAALTTPGIASVAFFEEWGARGIRSSDGEPYPVAEALGVLAGLAGVPVEVGGSARPPLGAAEYSPGRMCPAGEIASIEG